MAVLQGEFCAVNIEVAFRAEPNGRYIEVAVLQRAGIARVYCTLEIIIPATVVYTCRNKTIYAQIVFRHLIRRHHWSPASTLPIST